MNSRGDPEQIAHKLTAAIKRQVRADKKEHLSEQFRENKEDPHKKHLWTAVKNLKGKFSPKFIQIRNTDGMRVPFKKRAEAIADYLEQQHWQNNAADGKDRVRN